MTLEQLIQKAQSLEKEGDYVHAVEYFSEAIKLSPNSADLYSWRGVVLFHLNKKYEALTDMNKAVELQPGYSYRYSSRAYVKADLRMTEEAIQDYQKCIELDPKDSVAYNNLGMLEEQLGRDQKAKRLFEKADRLSETSKEKETIPEKEEAKQQTTDTNSEISSDTEESLEEETRTRWQIIKDVFTKKEKFKEFIQFIKNGFKLK